MKNRIWVDVTVIMSWEGTFTGIQRVVYSYVKRFSDNKDVELRLFTFDGRNYNETSYEGFLKTLKHNSTNKAKPVQATLMTKLRGKGLPVLKREIGNTKYVGPVFSAAYKSVRSAYRIPSSLRKRLQKTPVDRATPFGKDDTVLLIDGNWSDHGVFAKSIVSTKNQVGFRLVHIVNDVIALKNPALVARGANKVIGRYFRILLPAIDTLVSISRSTQSDVERFCEQEGITLTPNRHVVRLGDELESLHEKKIKPKKPVLDLDLSRFILTVGTIEVRKNYHLLYYVYKLANEKGILLPNLVIAGRSGWMSDETVALFKNDPEVSNKVIILNPTDAELAWLYQSCDFTVFPSLYEGWGIPVVESVVHNKLCIASSTSSTPEVVGDLAIYVSPYSPEELLKQLQTYMKAPSRKRHEDKISKSFKLYTWDQSAADLWKRISETK